MQTTRRTSLSSAAPTSVPVRKPLIGLWLTVVVVVYLVDQGTKWWAERALDDGRPRALVGDLLQLHLTHNPGAAFSTGTGYTAVLTVVALVVIAVCISMASRLRSPAWAVALGLVLGGALGNVTDRLFRAPGPFRGHVVDFLELPHWPIFNIADSAISVAAVLFVVLSAKGIRLDGTRLDDDRPEE
jgi:signal peptidase II